MDPKERERLYTSMPWTFTVGVQGLCQVIDKDGDEVPLLSLLKFACDSSRVIAKRREQNEQVAD